MCINVTNKKPKPTGVGYKVFTLDGRYAIGSNVRNDRTHRPTKRWLHENRFRPSAYRPDYGYGWHIYNYLSDAIASTKEPGHMEWLDGKPECVRRVRYRQAFAEGEQIFSHAPTVVAKEIFIIPGEIR